MTAHEHDRTHAAACGCGAHDGDAVGRRAVAVDGDVKQRNLKHCAATAIRTGDGREAEGMYDELIEMMYKHSR